MNSQPIEILGAVFLTAEVKSVETNLVAFVTPEIHGPYRPRQALMSLNVTPKSFPMTGDAKIRVEKEETDERSGAIEEGPG